MVKINYLGRLGNNLFQYALGRIIAEKRGYKLIAESIPGFDSTKDMIDGEEHECEELRLTGHLIDFHTVLSEPNPNKIVLDGFFQRYEYYQPYLSSLRTWFKFDPTGQFKINMVPDLLVHIRRTDYVQLGQAMPFEFFDQLIQSHLPEGGRLMIATDDSQDPFLWRFKKWKPKIFSGGILELMALMQESPRLIMSQSTFSWWPAFLGEQRMVLCPDPSYGLWGNQEGLNLVVPGYIEPVSWAAPYQPSKIEALYQAYRLLNVKIYNRLAKLLDSPKYKM